MLMGDTPLVPPGWEENKAEGGGQNGEEQPGNEGTKGAEGWNRGNSCNSIEPPTSNIQHPMKRAARLVESKELK
jgi:hypothetical protein